MLFSSSEKWNTESLRCSHNDVGSWVRKTANSKVRLGKLEKPCVKTKKSWGCGALLRAHTDVAEARPYVQSPITPKQTKHRVHQINNPSKMCWTTTGKYSQTKIETIKDNNGLALSNCPLWCFHWIYSPGRWRGTLLFRWQLSALVSQLLYLE